MTPDVISHRRARRKRAAAWAWAARRFGALAVTLAALATATWLAPYFAPPAQENAVLAPPAPARLPVGAAAYGEKAPAALAEIAKPNQQIPVRAAARRPRPIPLDADVTPRDDGFEILSAAELAAISQARN